MNSLRGWITSGVAIAVCCTAAQADNPTCVNGPQGPFLVGGTGPRTVTINCKELSLDPPGADCTSTGAGQISGAGATLFIDFFRSGTGYNDWIDVDSDTWSGSFGPFPGVDILSELWNPSTNINTHWMFQYRSVGSVNGYNEFVDNQLCLAIPITVPTEAGLFNQFEYATTGVITWGGPYDNTSGTPVEPCEIEFSFLDVPSKWATQVPGGAGVCVPGGAACASDLDCLPDGRCSVGPLWNVEPEGSGYGLNPIMSSTGVLSNLQSLSRQCGTCSVSGAPCARNSNCPSPQTCNLAGPTLSLNANTATPDADTIFDFPSAWVPVAAIANRGTGLRDVKYSQLQYLYVTGRMPNGENLIGGNRSVGSGTRNAHVNSLGIDTSWARGDNLGTETSTATAYNVGPNTQPTNSAGSSNMEAVIQSRRLSVGHTGLAGASRAAEDAVAGSYEILNICKDVDTDGNPLCNCTAQTCPEGPKFCSRSTTIPCITNAECNPTSTHGTCVAITAAAPNNGYVRATVNTVLDNANACCGYTIGGLGSFVTRGNRNANRDLADPEYEASQPLDNQAVADYLNNISDSIRDFVAAGNISPRVCNFSEVCSTKRCSISLVSCTGTGQGTCAAGNLCQFIPCDSVVGPACPGGFGTCGLNANCLNDADCADKGCSVTNVDCNTDPDCIDETCDTVTTFTCTQTGGPCSVDADCPARSQTCNTDRCRTGNNMAGQFLATDFFLGTAIDAVQSLTDGMVFTPQALNQAAQNAARAASLTVVPAFGSVNSAGRVPTRNALASPGYSDGSTTGSYTYHNGTSYVTNFASGQRLACRNRIAGDFNEDCVRDINDASELVKAQYTPRAWQLTAPANGAPAACMTTLPCDSGQQSPGGNQNAIPEVLGDFNGDGNLNKEDLRYFADGLAISGGALNRKAGAIAIDAAILAAGQALPWNDPAQSLTVPPVSLGTDPTHTAPIDVNDVGSPFLKTGKVYANGDFRGDVAGAAGGPTAGAHPRGWDSVVDGKDIDYCCYMAQIGDWANIDDAVYIDLSCDMTGDLDVDADDVSELVEVILGTAIGDVNLDGVVDDDDRAIASATIAAGAGGCNGTASCGWADGDTNCDKIVDESDLASVPPPAPIYDPNAAKTRVLSMTLTPAATATGSGRQTAIQITMVDLEHPVPGYQPSANPLPKNFTTWDTNSNGTCTNGDHAGHHCDVAADCRLCGGSGFNANKPCSTDAECTVGGQSNFCPTSVCSGDARRPCSTDGNCTGFGTCGSPIAYACGGLAACTGEGAMSPGGVGGCARWVGKPEIFLERQLPAAQTLGDYLGARLQCTPFYHDWGAEGLIHVFGAEILPNSRYSVQTYAASCKGSENVCLSVSAATEMRTRRAGDVVALFNPPDNSQQPNVTDIGQVVAKFKGLAGSPSNSAAVVQPNIPDPNSDVGVSDIVQIVDMAKQFVYPFGGPCPCPSLAVCGATPCPGGAGTCLGSGAPGLGAESTCVKLCRGGSNAGEQCNNHLHCGGGGVCDKECVGGTNNAQGCSGNGDCGKVCLGGPTPGAPCTDASTCDGGTCPTINCVVVTNNAFCRDRCGRCTP